MTATVVPVAGAIGVGPIGATVQPRPMVEATGVSKWFGDVVAVSDVSFALGSGVTALLGPNGAGKSTMLRLLAGLIPPDRGELRILGRDPRVDIGVLRRIGLVPQQETVFDTQTAYEFVHMAGVLHGIAETRPGGPPGARARRARVPRPTPAEHVLPGHAPAGQGRAGDRAQPARSSCSTSRSPASTRASGAT